MEKVKKKQAPNEDILAHYRAITNKNRPSRNAKNFRAILKDSNLQEAFDKMTTPDGKWNEEGKALALKYNKIPLDTSGKVTYYVYGPTQKMLYQFICFYLAKELHNRKIAKYKELEESGQKVTEDLKARVKNNVKSLKPVIIFASTLISKLVGAGDSIGDKLRGEIELGDGHETLFIIYIPNVTLHGRSMEFFASKILEYATQKNRGDKSASEHVIVLAESNFNEFTISGIPVINLSSGELVCKSETPTPVVTPISTPFANGRLENGEID